MKTIDILDALLFIFVVLNILVNILTNNINAILGWFVVGICLYRIQLYKQDELKSKKYRMRK